MNAMKKNASFTCLEFIFVTSMIIPVKKRKKILIGKKRSVTTTTEILDVYIMSSKICLNSTE